MYKMKTTFWQDFTIADVFGEDAVEDTYRRAFDEWKSDVEYVTELCMVLNWKIWEHYEKQHDGMARLYDGLWRKCDEWCCKNLKGKDLEYYYRTTD